MEKLNQSGSRDQSGIQQQQQVQEKKSNKKDTRTRGEAKAELSIQVGIARQYLLEGKNEDAIDVAFKALFDLKEELGGENSILLLPGYFVLAESYIAENKLKKAEEFLIAAYWNFLKCHPNDKQNEDDDMRRDMQQITEDDTNIYRGTLHKTFSKLFLAQKDYSKALDELNQGIYMDCVKYGPEHPMTSLAYFQMGNIFLEMKKNSNEGESFYAKTAEIQYKYFKKQMRRFEQDNVDFQTEFQQFDDIMVKEALEYLQHIQFYFETEYPEEDDSRKFVCVPLINTYRALALIPRFLNAANCEEKYKEYIERAYRECLRWKGEDHKKAQKLKEQLAALGDEYMMKE